MHIDKNTGQLAGPNCPPERVQDQVFEVPPKDLDNLVPYDKVLEWAKSAEWKLPPDATSSCN